MQDIRPATPTASPGTANGKLNAGRLIPGVRVLVERTTSGGLCVAVRKTGAVIATVTGAHTVPGRRQRRLVITTDLGEVTSVSASQTFFLADPS
jgi:hypothetical protein